MSISGALSNALSGLTASARAAEVVSTNVSNALTEGFARRELGLSSRSLGGEGAGVRIDGVSRVVNRSVLGDRRLADAAAANAGLRQQFHAGLERSIGTSDQAGSLTARMDDLESALIAAASRPDSEARLQQVLVGATDLARTINTVSGDIQAARMAADHEIAAQVTALNDALVRIDDLNATILAQRSAGSDATALMDQRQLLVDRVSAIVPVREVQRDHDQISLYTTGGAVLLEGNPVMVGFSAVGVITPDMTQASGALSGLTLNDRPMRTTEDGVLGGGSLAALFAVRDELAVSAQGQLDAVARDLIGRFAAPGVDPTLATGAAGLFADGGLAFDPLDEVGLSARLSVNALANPAEGGALWRLRDGLGAAAPGDVGNAAILQALAGALAAPQIPASGSFLGAARSASGLAADLLSQVSGARQSADDASAFAGARQSTLAIALASDGVDTDAEMQSLLMIEQSYAANARVISALDEMIRQILGM
ncbi:MAG: flagellar hook-associated protein FlgK [Defluviimonas sp.]|nr:flagellar hook-associated protein FlgK [Defluviimonas sp.]